jgi:hypothetical protein
MKMQIRRLSPHQNAKVLAVISACIAAVVAVPMFLFSLVMGRGQGFWVETLVLLAPVAYLIFTYIVVALICGFYNLLVNFIGGLEYEPLPEPGLPFPPPPFAPEPLAPPPGARSS